MASGLMISGAGGALGSALVRYFSEGEARVVAAGRGVDQAALDAACGAGRVMAAPLEARLDGGLARARHALGGRRARRRRRRARGGRPGAAAPLFTKRPTRFGPACSPRISRRRARPCRRCCPACSSAAAAASSSSRLRLPHDLGSTRARRPTPRRRPRSLALVQSVAAEVLANGVRINAVLPSTIDTPANRAGQPEADFTPWVTPVSLAGVIAFLLSDAARDISGAAVPVYGKLHV